MFCLIAQSDSLKVNQNIGVFGPFETREDIYKWIYNERLAWGRGAIGKYDIVPFVDISRSDHQRG